MILVKPCKNAAWPQGNTPQTHLIALWIGYSRQLCFCQAVHEYGLNHGCTNWSSARG
jgi:hypothetical protein